MPIARAFKETAKYVFKNGKRTITNGAKNGANGAAKKAAKKAAKPPPRVLKKADYEGNSLNKFGYNKRDWVTLSDQSAGKQKPFFRDEAGELHFHQSNGKTESQFIHRDTKLANNLDRSEKGRQQTKPDVRGKDFLKDAPQDPDIHAHHIAPIKSLQFLFDGLNEADRLKLINHFERRGVYIGNDPRNAAFLKKPIHTSVHESYVKKAILKYNHASLEGMPLKDRFKFANVILQEIKEAKKIVDRETEVWISPDQLNKAIQRQNQPELALYDRS